MRSEARLDSAVFQLTPTRTRCELVIIANGKTEKLASGLLNPFVTHLKAAQDQIAKGGYSIKLEPDPAIDAFWFTKGTLERFVRFVSTPEVLERVATIESEILQIEDAITIQGNESLGLGTVEDHPTTSAGRIEGSKHGYDADAEKVIVLYKPGSQSNLPDSNGSAAPEENSKVQLLRVLETRKVVLQREQAMAFARATAAGFDMDHMAHLIAFAECFGASRLKEACLRFMELWRVKHETGQWIEVEAAEAMSMRSGFSPFNPSGIILAGDMSKQREFGETSPPSGVDLGADNNGHEVAADLRSDKRLPSDPQGPGTHEYFNGQFQQPTYPPWAMHPPPGPHVYPPYPMQGMPYYQNYPGTGPFYPAPYPPPEDPRFNAHQRRRRRHSMTSKDNDVDSEMGMSSARSPDEDEDESSSESEKEASNGQKSHRRSGRSGKKKSGVVVIKNLNYIASKKHDKSGDDSKSASGSGTEDEENSHSDASEKKHKKSSGSSKKNKHHRKSLETSNTYNEDEMVLGNDVDSGNWNAFQSFLLRAEEKMSENIDGDMFAGEKEPQMKRKQKSREAEPILIPDRDSGNIHEARIMELDSLNGKATTRQVLSNDELLTPPEARELRESHLDAQSIELERGGGGYRRVANDDFMIYGQENQVNSKSSLDPVSEQGYGHPGNLERSSYVATDESFIVPFRSASPDKFLAENRTTIDIDLELPSVQMKEDSSSNANTYIRYEPDDLTMLPERATETMYGGYDPAIDYETEMPIDIPIKQETLEQEDMGASCKDDLKKSDKERKLKNSQAGLDRKKKDAMMRKGIPSRSNPLTEAQKRAEKLRAYKVDLQKTKKLNEEEERKRLEHLKLERQKRIAARGGSNTIQPPVAAKEAKMALPSKVSPSSFKGSKFSDPEPGSNSPLRKHPVRSSSIESADSLKTTKISRTNATNNGISKSVPSLPEIQKESNGVTPEAKTAAAPTKRLSDPSVRHTQQTTRKAVTTGEMPKGTNGPQTKKISAMVQLDKTKSAALKELKTRTPEAPSNSSQNKSIIKETLQQGPGSNSLQASGDAHQNRTDENPPRLSHSDDNTVIEKTVVMLENGSTTSPAFHASQTKAGVIDHAKEKAAPDSEYAAIRAPPSPMISGEVEDHSEEKPDNQLDSYEVANNFPKDDSQNLSKSVTKNFYQAPYARETSFEDPAAATPEPAGTQSVQSEVFSVRTESIKPRVSFFLDASLVDQTNESVEKPRSKESKGFRKLLKFGRKSHGSASGDGNTDSDGSVADDGAEASSSNEVHILKNLISQDDTHSGGTPARVHRPFSILSPFRSSKSSEKKLAA